MEDRDALREVDTRAQNALGSAFETIWTENAKQNPLVLELVSNLSHLSGYVTGYLQATEPELEKAGAES